MAVVRFKESRSTQIKEGISRKLIHGNDIMMVIIDFANGPWDEPDAYHNHPHEQTTYVAEGEIVFFCEDEPEQRLSAGDMFYVPSNKKHTIQVLSKNVRLIDTFNPIRQDFL